MKERLLQLWNKQIRPRLSKGWMEIKLFITSALFLKNFAGMVGTGIGILLLTFWWMKCYTNHGESLQVHDYTGMTVREAVEKAEDRSFRITILDSIWREGYREPVVLQQNPKPFSRVKKNRTIYLTVTKQQPPEVLLPVLTGSYNFSRYKKKCDNKGIKLVVKERVYDGRQAPNTILYLLYKGDKLSENDIQDGIKIPKGSILECVVTERTPQFIEIPDLVCLTYTSAEFLLNSNDLTPQVIEDSSVGAEGEAYVYRQEPEPGANVRVGSMVKVYLTQELPTGCQ